jgi:hypothetical protein
MAGTVKAGATVLAGGGPEDPIADAAAASQLSGSEAGPGKAGRQLGGLGGQKSDAGKPASEKRVKALGEMSDSRRLLLTEFIVCVAVLGFGTLVPTPAGRRDEGMAHLLVKGTALSLLFFVLALIGSSGAKAGRAASGIGGLVTAAYLLTSEDAYHILAWISAFYGKPGSNPGTGIVTTSYSGQYAGAVDIDELIGPPRTTAAGTSETGRPTGTGGTLYA